MFAACLQGAAVVGALTTHALPQLWGGASVTSFMVCPGLFSYGLLLTCLCFSTRAPPPLRGDPCTVTLTMHIC